jgi:hypothetical protein
MTQRDVDKASKRLGPEWQQAGHDSRPALPQGALRQASTAYERFWARRGMQVPNERFRSRSMAQQGERGPA